VDPIAAEQLKELSMADEKRKDVLLTDEVRELVALIKNTDIAEVLIENGESRLHIKRVVAQPSGVAPATPQAGVPVASVPSNGVIAGPAEVEPELPPGITVTAPIVGTFYRSSAPKEPPYVQEGDEVKPGDVLGLIEAMKIMNEIECEIHGRVVQFLVENAQPVEYGQPLMIIEPL
jgi:acetyl-CoA carboxylase biotin carboxyl carrier protein